MTQIKIEARSRDLLKAFSTLSAAIPSNPLVPMYGYVKIDVYKSSKKIFLTSSDSRLTVKVFLEAGSVEILSEETSFTVPFDDTSKLLKSLPDAPISMGYEHEGINFTVKILSQTQEYVLAAEDARDFPVISQGGKDSFQIDAGQLKEGIGYLKDLVPPSKETEFKPFLAGIYFDFKPKYLTLVGFDGNMSLGIFETDVESAGFDSFTLPLRAVSLLYGVLSNSSDPVGFTLSAKQVSVEYGNICVTASLMEGSYPLYRSEVTPEPRLTATVDLEAWKPALTRAMIFSDSTREALHAFQEDFMFISSEDPMLSKKSMQDIPLEDMEGEPLEILVNGDKLLKLLAAVGGSARVEIKKAFAGAKVESMYIFPEVVKGRSTLLFLMPIVRNNY